MADDIQDIGTNTLMWREQPNWVDDVENEMLFSRDIPEYPSSSMDLLVHTAKVPRKIKYSYDNLSKQKELELLNFFTARKGRHGGFWLVGYNKEMQVSQDIPSGTKDIVYENNSFLDGRLGHERIFILLKNGDLITRQIDSAVYFDPEETQIYSTVVTAWDRSIVVPDIFLVGRLWYVRFDTDELKTDYEKIDISSVTLNFYELVEEYP